MIPSCSCQCSCLPLVGPHAEKERKELLQATGCLSVLGGAVFGVSLFSGASTVFTAVGGAAFGFGVCGLWPGSGCHVVTCKKEPILREREVVLGAPPQENLDIMPVAQIRITAV